MNTPSPTVTPFPPRIPIREMITNRILDFKGPQGERYTTQSEFEAWLNRTWADYWYGQPKVCRRSDADDGKGPKAIVRDQATAKALIASWIEERIKAREGVWFGDKSDTFTVGLRGRPSIPVQAPSWMPAYINQFPNTSVRLTGAEKAMLDRGEALLQAGEEAARERRLALLREGEAA